MLCTSIFVRGQDESQETNPKTLDSQKSSYLIAGQKSNQFWRNNLSQTHNEKI